MRKSTFFKKVFMVDVKFELTTSSASPTDDAMCEDIRSPLGYVPVKFLHEYPSQKAIY